MAKGRWVKSKYNDAQWAWVTEKYKQGYSTGQLAEFLGLGRTTVFDHVVKRLGRAERWKSQPLDREEFESLREE